MFNYDVYSLMYFPKETLGTKKYIPKRSQKIKNKRRRKKKK